MAQPPKPVRRPTFPAPETVVARPPIPPQTAAPPAAPPGSILTHDALPEAIARLPISQTDDTGKLHGPAVVQPRELSDLERQGLKLIGHDPTKPVPKEVLEQLSKLSAEEKSRLTGAGSLYDQEAARLTRQPTVPPKAVNIGDLSSADQQQALGKMNDLLHSLGRPSTQAPPPSASKPIVSSPWAAPPVPPTTPTPTHPEPVSDPLPEPTNDAGGLGSTPKFCPRCGFDCQDVDSIRPTDEEMTSFLTCVLAVPARRFTKTYHRFGNRLALTFGELGPTVGDEVSRALHRKANHDVEDNNPGSQMFYANMGANYRALLSLTRLDTVDQTFDLSTGWADAKAAGKKVEDYIDWLVAEVVPTDSVLVVVRRAYDEFRQLCDKLREAAAHPDFYTAIG